MKERWWKERKGGGKCKEVKDTGAAALGLSNVGGVFVVLIGGMGVACLIAVAEYYFENNRRQKRLGHSTVVQFLCNTFGTIIQMANDPIVEQRSMTICVYTFKNLISVAISPKKTCFTKIRRLSVSVKTAYNRHNDVYRAWFDSWHFVENARPTSVRKTGKSTTWI